MITIKKIVSTKQVPKKDGSGSFPVNQVLTTDDEVGDVMGNVKEGDQLEGIWEETQYGKRFKKAGGDKKFFAGAKSDPNTMLIAYAKDIVVAMTNTGLVKTGEKISEQIRNFSQLFFGIYDLRTQGKKVIEPKKEAPKDEEPAPEEPEEPKTEEEEINLEELPF